ncbi:MAG: LCP family protein [Firmicutes bacterium]|nr:LCP family protein [Bacillota bacterium]
MSEKDELQNNGAEPQKPGKFEPSVELSASDFSENTAVEYDSFEDEDSDFLFPIDEIVEPPRKGKKKKKKKEKKKSKFRMVVYIIVLVCLAVLFGWLGYVGAYLYPMFMGGTEEEQATPIQEQQQEAFESGQLTVLLMGSDRREGEETSRSDTLMVAFVDLYEKEIRLLSMPRDTYVTIPGTGEKTKLNHAYFYGGVDLAKQTLLENFGIDCEYYMDVDFQGFIDIVDTLGGVTVNVPKKMYYPAEGIDLEPGIQKLDGDKALQFCRFRSDPKGDLGRIERQQAFLVALKESMFSAGSLFKIPELCTAVSENVKTDFTGTQILQIALAFKDGVDFQTYQPDNIPEYLDGISYVFITDNGQALIDALVAFAPIPENINAPSNTLDVTVDGAESAAESEGEEGAETESTTGEEMTP